MCAWYGPNGATDRQTARENARSAFLVVYHSWARPRGAQLFAGYNISAPAATLFLRRAAYFDFNGVPYHCASAPRCDLLNQPLAADRQTRTDAGHDLPDTTR